MRTKYLLIPILVLFFIAPTFGQKIKDKKVEIKYVQLPAETLPADYKTYSVRVYGSAVGTAGLNASSQANSIKMDGFKRLDGTGSNFGHLRVSVYAGYVNTGRAEFKSKTTTTKDKEGNEKKSTSYWYEIPFSVSTSYRVVDPEGNNLATYNNTYRKTMETRKSSSSSQVRKSLSSNRSSLRKSFASQAVKAIVGSAQGTVRNKFDYDNATYYGQLYFIKKHKAEADFEKHFEKVKDIFAKAAYSTPASELKTKLQSSMEFYAKHGSTNPKGDKKMMRVYRACNYNLALINYFLDELDTAKEYAELVIKSEGKDGKSKRLIERIEKTQKRQELHGIKTLHYVRDLSDAMAPSKVKAFEEEKEELAAENNSLGGTIVMNGETIEGSVMQSKGVENMIFGEKGNTKFMKEDGGKMKEYDLTSADISGFTIGDRKFVKMNFSPCAKGKEEAKMCILEEIYTSDKINLYQYYPTTGALGDEKTEFAFKKASEEAPTSLLDTQFLLWNKGLANYFSDCTDLKDMCASGGLKMTKDDLLKASRIYSELCN